jgi:hypothetical protein
MKNQLKLLRIVDIRLTRMRRTERIELMSKGFKFEVYNFGLVGSKVPLEKPINFRFVVGSKKRLVVL